MPVQLPPVETVLAYGRGGGRLRQALRRAVFALTKSNLHYSRTLVETALEQLGVATEPTHRIVGSTDLRQVSPTGTRADGTATVPDSPPAGGR